MGGGKSPARSELFPPKKKARSELPAASDYSPAAPHCSMDRQVSTRRNDLECMLLDETSEPMALPLFLLEDITCGFSADQEIGRGGSAVVYKGTLSNGLTVAVKRLSNCYMHEKEFHREIECLLKVKHTNIVRFLGYCADTQGSMADFNGKVVMADVQQRLLCFEFLPKGSLDGYIQDASSGLDWSKRYKIIKGVCEGLSYLHQKKIIHLDLKPANILLNANMIPKISDFGLSRTIEEDKSRFVATKVGGTFGYLAPEFTSNEITHKFDLYSLGVILIEILTGKKGYQSVETVLESWSNRLDKSQGDTSFEQIRVCTEIGIECIDPNPIKRPLSIHHIVTRLNEMEYTQVNAGSDEILDAQPLVLRFPFEPNKYITCSLQLTNNTDKHVKFHLNEMQKGEYFFKYLPPCGVVPPMSAYTLFVTKKKLDKLPEKKYIDLILKSTILGDGHDYLSSTESEYNERGPLKRGKIVLKAVSTMQQGTITSEVLHVKIPYEKITYLETNPTKQWIIVGHYAGRIRIWSYETQKLVGSFKVSSETVCSVKFIERKKWFVAGTTDGFIHVYSYAKMKRIKSFRANTDSKSVKALAVHPTQSYVLSVSAECNQAKLWDWNRSWQCTQTFTTEYSNEILFVFNPMDITIASASKHTVKIWGPDSVEPKYTLSGHSGKVNCMEVFTCNDHQYLITGSNDCTAKIWDMQKKMCAHTLETPFLGVFSVHSSPNLPILITGSSSGTLHFWSSANFRLEKVVHIGSIGFVDSISSLMYPRRLVIGNKEEIAVLCIGNVGYEPGSTDSCEQQLNAYNIDGKTTSEDTNVSAREKSMGFDHLSEVILGTTRLLDVHPMSSSLFELVNNIDEHVAFRFKGPGRGGIPQGGILPAKSTYTVILEYTEGAILESSISGDRYVPFKDESECDEFFEEAKEMGNPVHELALETIFARQGETPFPAIPPITEIIMQRMEFRGGIIAFDVHPSDLMILKCVRLIGRGHIFILENYDASAKTLTIDDTAAYSVRFVAQKKLFVAATTEDSINVYNYGTDIQKITSFRSDGFNDIRLGVHPTQSYVSSLSAGLMKIWDWKKDSPDLVNGNTGWKCTQTFEAIQYCLEGDHAVFNPTEMNCFAVALDDYTIKVSNLDSRTSNYILSGHSAQVNCLAFFKRADKHYLITGSRDCTAKIWDLQRKTCVHTLRAFMSPVISVISLQDFPYLILSSEDGIIHIWNSRNSRLQRMVSCGFIGQLPCLYLMAKRKVVILHDGSVSFMDIGDEGSAMTSLQLEWRMSTYDHWRRGYPGP